VSDEKQKPVTDSYRENWKRIWGKKKMNNPDDILARAYQMAAGQSLRPESERGLPEWELWRRDMARAGFDVCGNPLKK
jgi:hypothetical protein